jgi:arylsulfatase A-like enzyme
VALAVLAASCSPRGSSQAAERELAPVVLVSVDTLRADALERERAWGTDGPLAAALDPWLAESIRFERAFAHAPSTLPSHTSLFSGRDIGATGVVENGQAVPADLPLLAEALLDAGYQTSAVISIGTLWSDRSARSLERGFERFDQDFGHDGLTHLAPASQTLPRVRAALDDLNADRPPFLFLHFADPHAPYNSHGNARVPAALWLDGELARELDLGDMRVIDAELPLAAGRHSLHLAGQGGIVLRTLELTRGGESLPFELTHGRLGSVSSSVRWEFDVTEGGAPVRLRLWASDLPVGAEAQQRYGLEVDAVAEHLAELREELRARDLWERAWVILTSDHGEGLGDHDHMDHVIHLHDELLRVPLAIKPPAGWSGAAALEDSADRLVGLSDLAPTLLDGLGLPPLVGATGQSLLAGGDPTRVLVFETHAPAAPADQVALRDSSNKLILRPLSGDWELYDLSADPGERSNLHGRTAPPKGWTERLEALGNAALEREHHATTGDAALLKALGYTASGARDGER